MEKTLILCNISVIILACRITFLTCKARCVCFSEQDARQYTVQYVFNKKRLCREIQQGSMPIRGKNPIFLTAAALLKWYAD
jgi:hypothetical protein